VAVHSFDSKTSMECRLAHINMKALKKIVRKYAATRIKADDLKGDISGHDCHLDKETRKPFPALEG
jgi:hypothetical protein